MKKLIITLFIIFTYSICLSQIAYDYPFKTYLDNDNNLYVTGFEQIGNTKDLYVAKYPPVEGASHYWVYRMSNPSGDDKGLDLKVDSGGNCFVTGYKFNSATDSNDIILINLRSDGTERWTRTYENVGDDKGMGIEISLDNDGNATDIYLSGYLTSSQTGKDFFVKKYNKFGDSLWQYTSTTPGDDVATDILLDNGHAYAVGYTTESNGVNTDLKLMSLDLESGNVTDDLVYSRPGVNEKPIEFLITYFADVPVAKSRLAVLSVTDQSIMNYNFSRYLTSYFAQSDVGQPLELKWSDIAQSSHFSLKSVPTSIAKDNWQNIYVTGYMGTPKDPVTGQSNGLDFATVKYNTNTGGYGWRHPNHIAYSNYNDTSTTGMNDRASSIKVNDVGNIYVAGMSDGSPNGFSVMGLKNENGAPIIKKAFVPYFLDNNRATVKYNKWAKLELANDGTPLMIVMGWNETEAHWAAIKYDSAGNVEYTINNEQDSDANNNEEIKTEEKPEITSLKNYPNPFNPGTNLEFGISNFGFVNIKIYNVLGKEVAELVNEIKEKGIHSVTFDGSRLSSGIYYYTMSVNGVIMETKSMVLMK